MNAVKLYFAIVGAIAGCLFMYALANRPQPDELKAKVETSLAEYRRTHPGAPAPKTRADDWWVAGAYTAKLDGAGTFRCFGAANVSICTSPDDPK